MRILETKQENDETFIISILEWYPSYIHFPAPKRKSIVVMEDPEFPRLKAASKQLATDVPAVKDMYLFAVHRTRHRTNPNYIINEFWYTK